MDEPITGGDGLSPEEQGILALRGTEQQEEVEEEKEEEQHDEEEDEFEREPDQQLQEEAEEHQAVTEEGGPNNEEQEDDEQENESPDNGDNGNPDNDMPDSEEPENREVEEGETQNTEPDSQNKSSTPQLGEPEHTQPQNAQHPQQPPPQPTEPQQIQPYPAPRLIQPYPPQQYSAQPQPPPQEPKTWKHLWDMDRQRRAAQEIQAQSQQGPGYYYGQGPPQPGQPYPAQPYPGPPPYQQAQPFPGPVYQGQPYPGPPAYQGPIPPGQYIMTGQNLQPLVPPPPRQRGRKVPKADLSQPRPLYTILPAGWNPNTMPGPPPMGKRLLPPLSQTLAQPQPQPTAPPEPPQPKAPRPPARQYTDEQRQKVWDLHQQGLNHAEISAQTDVTAATIPSILKRFRDRGGKLADNPKGGRKPKMRECDFRHLMLLIERDPTLTARELKVLSGLDISVQTIERELEKREVERNPAKKRRKLLRAERDKAREEGRLVDEDEAEAEDEGDKEEEQVPKTWGDLYRILDPKPKPNKGRRKPGEPQSVRKAFGYKN